MSSDRDIKYKLISAVRDGNVERARQLISSYGLSYSKGWSGGYVLLRDAVENKHTAVAKLLLTSGSRVNSKSIKPSYTPLHFAARNRDTEIVQMLLDRGAIISAKNQYGSTPLHIAIQNKSKKVTELLLKHTANVNARDNGGLSPLHVAVQEGRLQTVEHLLKHGADVNARDNDGISPLHFAVQVGRLQTVEHLLKHGADVNARDNDGITTLHFAVQVGRLQTVEHLLKHGADVNCVCTSETKHGYVPLHFAVERSNDEIMTLLLSRRATVDVWGEDGLTPIHVAALEGYVRIAEDLLNHGASIHSLTWKEGYTPLHIATERGHETVVKLFLQHGAEVDKRDKDGKTVLHLAVQRGSLTIVEDVLKYCPDINDQSNRSSLIIAVQGNGEEYTKIVEALLEYGLVNPADANNPELLHAAVEKGYLKIIEDLLKYGADVNTLYNSRYTLKGFTPLHNAAKNKQEEVAKLLISYGADINAQDESKRCPIFYAIENVDLKITNLLLTNRANIKDSPELLNIAVKKGCIEIVEVLLQLGADINASDQSGRTAMHFTAFSEKVDFFDLLTNKNHYFYNMGKIAELLLSKGANVDARTKNGETTLHLSAERGNEEITTILLNKGANVNAEQKDGTTALHFATQNGHKGVVKVLLEFNAKVDSKINNHKTPLHLAAEKGYQEIIETLLKYGADINCRDKDGRTALHVAFQRGHLEVVIILLDYGSDINITSISNNYTPFDEAVHQRNKMNDFFESIYFSHHQYEVIVETFQRHIVKIKTANLYVSEKNLQSVSWNLDMSDIRDECEEEIAFMKSEKINNNPNISFYDILAKNTASLSVYLRNENIVQVLKSGDYKTKFPIYANMIETRFRKGMERKELLEEANNIFHSLFNNFPELPYDCTEKIFSYLCGEDLKNFNRCLQASYHQES